MVAAPLLVLGPPPADRSPLAGVCRSLDDLAGHDAHRDQVLAAAARSLEGTVFARNGSAFLDAYDTQNERGMVDASDSLTALMDLGCDSGVVPTEVGGGLLAVADGWDGPWTDDFVAHLNDDAPEGTRFMRSGSVVSIVVTTSEGQTICVSVSDTEGLVPTAFFGADPAEACTQTRLFAG